MTGPALAELTDKLAGAGFLLLGGFDPGTSDSLPTLSAGDPAASLLLVGSTGPSLWPVFSQSPEYQDGVNEPLDRYTKRVLGRIAADNGHDVVFPFEGPPYYPFQQWALRCGGFSQSPLGPMVHATYGPWLGFRAAFISADRTPIQDPSNSAGPCETCSEKPCLSVCPVSAISLENGYDVPRCQSHLRSSEMVDCWSGCLARKACPFGAEHGQEPENARFHMKSFLGLS